MTASSIERVKQDGLAAAAIGGVALAGSAIWWWQAAEREKRCDASGSWCIDEAVSTTFAKWATISTGTIAAIGLTVAGIAHYRRKR